MSIVAGLIAAGLLTAVGCGEKRQLSWHYATGAPQQWVGMKRVALAADITKLSDGASPGRLSATELTTVVAGELMARGYEVSILRLDPREAATRDPHDGTTRLDRSAERLGAGLVCECSMQAVGKSGTKSVGVRVPYVPVSPSVSESETAVTIIQASLRLSVPLSDSVLGTVTVRYDKPTKRIIDVVRDLGLGLDMIRDGKRPGTVELTGKPGEAKFRNPPDDPDDPGKSND